MMITAVGQFNSLSKIARSCVCQTLNSMHTQVSVSESTRRGRHEHDSVSPDAVLGPSSCASFNLYIALLFAPSLGKRLNKVPNLKSLRVFAPFAWARERSSVKMRSIESRFVTGPSNTLFGGAHVLAFQPGNFTGWDSDGVNSVPALSFWARWDECFLLSYLTNRVRINKTGLQWLGNHIWHLPSELILEF